LEVYSPVTNQPDPPAFRTQPFPVSGTLVDAQAALEECFFLGLRLNRGISLADISEKFGSGALNGYQPIIAELIADGLLDDAGNRLHLTPRGRLLSNEVFGRFLRDEAVHHGDTEARTR
jgi:oxygen-independent coproporphyrinogen-3 oxidase